MKTFYSTLIVTLLFLNVSAQDVFGKWKTIDENGTEKSIVEIYKEGDKVYGKIIELLNANNKDAVCDKCTGDQQNKPILGLMIIKDLSFDGTYYRNGTVLDPERGKTFKCRLSLKEDNSDVLEMRGYVAFMYETQFWKRVK